MDCCCSNCYYCHLPVEAEAVAAQEKRHWLQTSLCLAVAAGMAAGMAAVIAEILQLEAHLWYILHLDCCLSEGLPHGIERLRW